MEHGENRVPRYGVITIFPEVFPGTLGIGVVGRALREGRFSLAVTDLRSFAHDKHRRVDDVGFGGGAGMVMKPEPLFEAVRDARLRIPSLRTVLLSPQGRTLTQAVVRELAAEPAITFVCGRYQGIDERAREEIGEELSIGDFILSGGEIAAMAVIEAIVRTRPGVLGDEESLQETFAPEIGGLLEAPLYTRPADFEGRTVPEVLRNGNHKAITEWKRAMQRERTQQLRPDLIKSSDRRMGGST